MADEPVKKTVKKQTRKTTTKKVVGKAVTPTATKVVTPKATKKGLSLKFVLFTILVLFLASGGAFYVGYSADGAIDVNEKLSDGSTMVEGAQNSEGASNTNPPPLKERPKLEPASVETPAPTPEPEVEGVATSSNESAEINEGESKVESETTAPEDEGVISTDEAVDPAEETPTE